MSHKISLDAEVERVGGRDDERRLSEVVDAKANFRGEEVDPRHVEVRVTGEGILRAESVAVTVRYGAGQHQGGERLIAV